MEYTRDPQELWDKLQDFVIGHEKYPDYFRERLMKETGWSEARARLAIIEYKRFLLLGSVLPHAVTPSLAVDEVWHLHLIFTQNYRDGLEAGLLGRRFDHTPGNGQEGDEAFYLQQYRRTLDVYERLFGRTPPETIWPFNWERYNELFPPKGGASDAAPTTEPATQPV